MNKLDKPIKVYIGGTDYEVNWGLKKGDYQLSVDRDGLRFHNETNRVKIGREILRNHGIRQLREGDTFFFLELGSKCLFGEGEIRIHHPDIQKVKTYIKNNITSKNKNNTEIGNVNKICNVGESRAKASASLSSLGHKALTQANSWHTSSEKKNRSMSKENKKNSDKKGSKEGKRWLKAFRNSDKSKKIEKGKSDRKAAANEPVYEDLDDFFDTNQGEFYPKSQDEPIFFSGGSQSEPTSPTYYNVDVEQGRHEIYDSEEEGEESEGSEDHADTSEEEDTGKKWHEKESVNTEYVPFDTVHVTEAFGKVMVEDSGDIYALPNN